MAKDCNKGDNKSPGRVVPSYLLPRQLGLLMKGHKRQGLSLELHLATYLLLDSDEECSINTSVLSLQECLLLVGADLTIMGGSVFKQIATTARLHKKDLCPADKSTHGDGRKTRLT